jgi:hypothetical protein
LALAAHIVDGFVPAENVVEGVFKTVFPKGAAYEFRVIRVIVRQKNWPAV